MHKVIFYPVGNGDTSQIVLRNGKRLLFDFRHQKDSENESNQKFDLAKRLRDELDEENRDNFDVVAFTHGDNDHIANSTEFFELRYSQKYQGEGRIKINELWVPAAMIIETAASDQQSEEFVIWRQEARYRLKEGRGIQVFSKPEALKVWLEENGLSLESRSHLITDAGQLAKGFTLREDEVEFFCHSPFTKHVDEGEDLRNGAALIFQVRFEPEGTRYNYMAIGDSKYEVLEDIVSITQAHNNEDRLEWDLFNLPHHCSYRSLSPEKGEKETIPTDKVNQFLMHGQPDAYIVSSSQPIEDDPAAYEQQLPPHPQAKNTYLKLLPKIGGRDFLVTMEEPTKSKPEPLVFEISGNGGRLISRSITGAAAIITSSPPRAG